MDKDSFFRRMENDRKSSLEQIRARLGEGSYRVPTERVATAVIEWHQPLLLGRRPSDR